MTTELLIKDIDAKLAEAEKLGQSSQLAAAKECCNEVVRAIPNHPRAHDLLGIIALQTQQLPQAEQHFLIALNTGYKTPELLNHLGIVYCITQRTHQGIIFFEAALKLNPRFAVAKQHLVKSLISVAYQAHQNSQIEIAEMYYKQTIALQPNSPDILNNLGTIELSRQHYREAASYFSAAVQHNPQHLSAIKNWADLLLSVEHFEDAIEVFKQGLELAPNDINLLQNYLQTIIRSAYWQDYNTTWQKLYEQVKIKIGQNACTEISPYIAVLINFDSATQYAINKNHALQHFNQFKSQQFPKRQINLANKKIKVGYVSPDFRDHPNGHLTVRLLEEHDKNQFEIYAYNLGDPEGSIFRKRIQAATHFIDIKHLNPLDAAKKIRSDEIDILIDLRTYTRNGRTEIFAYKPAPIQMSWIGFAGTTGCDFFDYFIGDPTVIPEEQQPYFSEAILYMPYTYFPTDNRMPIASSVPSRSHYNLPNNQFVFCSFCSQHKIEPDIFDAWMQILKQTPNSVLWLISQDTKRSERLKNYAKEVGIDPNRIIFANPEPKAAHLARYCYADLCLDTFIYNGHTTTIDAFWAGAPVLCMLGETLATRVSAAICKAMEVPELIAESKEEYIAKAIDYAKNPEKIKALKELVMTKKQSAPLFNTTLFAQQLEKGFRHIVNCVNQQKLHEIYYVRV